ncbi:unnamed protein product [Thlaspi arvense]|uniref:Uncharacterized protein n=1 Tax=Thlaspi arvense TaxID=13288 RepID=A0AAU9STJ9_THLAR|nr:unnamed protein product [Thlaspi arvense]
MNDSGGSFSGREKRTMKTTPQQATIYSPIQVTSRGVNSNFKPPLQRSLPNLGIRFIGFSSQGGINTPYPHTFLLIGKKTSCFHCQSLSPNQKPHTKRFSLSLDFAEMDFHSLLRRDLQFLCKRNKIPANMTNLAMADALKALEIVEGLDEYLNQSDANVLQSPTTVAKQPPNIATRTTRRKTAVKAETQSSSQLVNRSCHMTSKSLAGEMEQENINKNVAQEPKTNNVKFEAGVPKTPAARSTRKASAATSCTSKVEESKKDESVQSVYSTRRSTRLLEKCMADLSLQTEEALDTDKPEKNEETEQKVSAQEKNPAGSEETSEEAEVIPGRDLSASMEKEWETLKNDGDQVVGDLELHLAPADVAVSEANTVALGDVAVSESNTETNKENMNGKMSDEEVMWPSSAESENSVVQQEETLQANKAICEDGLKKNDNDQEIGDLEVDVGDIPVLENANAETNNDDKVKGLSFADLKNDQAFHSLVQVDQQETEQALQENDAEPEKINNFDEESNVDSTDGDSETEQEEDDSGVDSDGTISEADSNKAVLGSETADEEMILSEEEDTVAAPTSPAPLLEEAKVNTTPFAADSISVQFPRPSKPTATPSKNSGVKLVNVENKNKENNMEMMMNANNNDNGERKGEDKKVKKVAIDEESLKDMSMRQLEKMVKALSIKSSNNRTALQILPVSVSTDPIVESFADFSVDNT